jgi:hypothetical protein
MLEEKLSLVGHLFVAEVSHIDSKVAFYKDEAPLHLGPGVHEIPNAEVSAEWERYLKRSIANPESAEPLPPPLLHGITARLEHGPVNVQVEGFSKWGIIRDTNGLDLKPGDPVAVILKGFNLRANRFEFELTTL